RGSSAKVPRYNGSSSNMPPPYFEPPAVSPLGSAAIPPVPNPTRPVNETARMAEETDRAAPLNPERLSHETALKGHLKLAGNPVVKLVLESIIVFGLCLVLYFIIRML